MLNITHLRRQEECSPQKSSPGPCWNKRTCALTFGLLFLSGLAAGTGFRWSELTVPNLIASSSDPANWQLHQESGVEAMLVQEGSTLRLNIRSSDGVYDHLKFFQRGIGLEEGHTYMLRFRARADTLRDVKVEACLDQPGYQNVGLDQIVPLLPEWQEFSETFTAGHVLPSDTELPCFVVGNKPGTIWLSRISVTEVKSH